jgi:hypothetical protein
MFRPNPSQRFSISRGSQPIPKGKPEDEKEEEKVKHVFQRDKANKQGK